VFTPNTWATPGTAQDRICHIGHVEDLVMASPYRSAIKTVQVGPGTAPTQTRSFCLIPWSASTIDRSENNVHASNNGLRSDRNLSIVAAARGAGAIGWSEDRVY